MRRRSNGSDLAIDLGTAATRLHGASRTAPISRPSVVWGSAGPQHALRGGVIIDTDAAAAVVGDLLQSFAVRRPHTLACVPTDATPAERAALIEAVLRAGAGAVCVVSEPLAAAVGAGIAIEGACAHTIVDLGEGVTDCAVVRDGEVLASAALRIGVADLRDAVRRLLADAYGVHVAGIEAERVLREVGVGPRPGRLRELRVVGTPRSGIGPVIVRVEAENLEHALEPIADRISAHVAAFVARASGELELTSQETEILLTGGGSLLHGMSSRMVSETQKKVVRAPSPLLAVIEGATRIASGGPRVGQWH